jgi:hypothetical protein
VARLAPASPRRGVVWALVIGGHLGALAILVQRYAADRSSAAQEPMQVVLLALPEKSPTPSPQDRPRTPRLPRAISAVTPPAPAVPDSPAERPPSAPRIDWTEEARTVAQSQALRQAPLRICGKDERPDPRRPDCRRAPHAFEWAPEVPRVGMDGLFPYVRVGDTCLVGLGFFSCHEKMPANSALFDEMRNPDASAGSVPDAPR